MKTTFRTRWSITLLITGPMVAIVLALTFALLAYVKGGLRLIPTLISGVMWFCVLLVVMRRKTSRRSLTVKDTGLAVRRDSFRLFLDWNDFERAERQKIAWLPIDVLHFRKGQVELDSAQGKLANIDIDKVRSVGADRAVQVGVYVAKWETSSIGASLASYRARNSVDPV
jgi:small-conductance mechanosensitive channel